MTNKEKTKLAIQIIDIEKQCQEGNNISKNLDKIAELIKPLSFQELIELDVYMEENFEKLNKKYLII